MLKLLVDFLFNHFVEPVLQMKLQILEPDIDHTLHDTFLL